VGAGEIISSLFCTGNALKQFGNALVTWLTHAALNIRRHMDRFTPPVRTLAAIAWLDRVELSACQRFNRNIRKAGMLRLFQIASRLGDGIIWYVLIAVLALFYGAAGRQLALQCAAAGVVGLLLYRALKNVLVRERPFMTHAAIVCAGRPLDRFSFPSGHTLHAVSFTLIVCSALPMLALLLVPLAVLIALSRVVLGLHYPSDVLAGAVLGATVGGITMRVLTF
jgi:undecaprenyl-diphosphatase